MRLGIDVSNIRGRGGGVTYLTELLRNVKPADYGFDQVIVYSGSHTLQQVEDRPYLRKNHDRLLDFPLPLRVYWQRFKLDHLLAQMPCDILFSPGATYGGIFQPYVTMSLNMLPFEWKEARRYGFSWQLFKFLILHITQLSAFKRSSGVIFPSKYAQTTIYKFMNNSNPLSTVIPMGVDERFFCVPRYQKPISHYTNKSPIRLLYVSPIAPYKHQWHVMEAVRDLRESGLPVMLELVGGIRNCRKRFYKTLSLFDPEQQWIRFHGEIAFEDISRSYVKADTFIFASSCEAGGSFIQLEAMAAGLPIACSDSGSMPEVLGDAGVYFDPENPDRIAEAVHSLLINPKLRADKAQAAFERAKNYTWERCAHKTFEFLSKIASGQA